MLEMEINTICCGKEMINLGDTNLSNMNLNSEQTLICGECGRIIRIGDFSEDDYVLKSLIENYEEKLKDTTIYRKLILGEEVEEGHKRELINETKEASADLYRKYEYPPEQESIDRGE